MNESYDFLLGLGKAFRRGGWAAVGAALSIALVGLFGEGLDDEVRLGLVGALTVLFTFGSKFAYNFVKEALVKKDEVSTD